MESLSDLDIAIKDDPNEFDLTVASLLVGLGAEEYIDIFRQKNIGQSTLVELTDEDLRELGVGDATIREKIISEVRSLPMYEENSDLNEMISHPYSAEEIEEIMNNTSKHIHHLQLSVIANKLALKKDANRRDCLVYKNAYASDVALKTIDAILETLESMEKIVEAGDEKYHKKQKRKRKKMMVSAVGGGVVLTLALLLYKSLKHL